MARAPVGSGRAATPLQVAILDQPQRRRRMRNPSHTFNLRCLPFGIHPFLIAPVMANDTLENLMFQARAVTDPIKNPLVGWWLEFYFFYVKLRDLSVRDNIPGLLLDPADAAGDLAAITTEYGSTTLGHHFYVGGATFPNWVRGCLERVINEYFRDEGEAWNTHSVTDTPPTVDQTIYLAQLSGNDGMDSLFDATEFDAEDQSITVGVDDIVKASEIELALRAWEAMKLANLTEMSFEDYLVAHGVRAPTVEIHRPELIRYVRQWQYPSNTIDPTNGTPRSAVSWTVAERASKRRYFKEPGFIFGVTVNRPKVYKTNQWGSMSSLMNNAYAWMGALLGDHPEVSRKRVTQGTGPLAAVGAPPGAAYIVDLRDLMMYGEQYVNYGASDFGSTQNGVALPTTTLSEIRYPSYTDITGLFVNLNNWYTKMDGVVDLHIASQIQDLTPRGAASNVP